MHSTETINQFLNFRAQGWSFARIADHLHVSKPTLIQWSHKHETELAVTKANHERSAQESAQASAHGSPQTSPSPPLAGPAWSEERAGERRPLLPFRHSIHEEASHERRLEHLSLFHTTLRQEIIKRTLQTLSDEEIQTMADAIEHQIEILTGLSSEALSAKDNALREEGALSEGLLAKEDKETR
jgi:hypothetical protein